ncbi:hypothetical protein ACFVMC_25905 [Nocardia sp. NPDC127579]
MSFRQIVAGGGTQRIQSKFRFRLRVAESEKSAIERVLGARQSSPLS